VAHINDVLRSNLRHSEVITAFIFNTPNALIYQTISKYCKSSSCFFTNVQCFKP